MHSVLIKNGLVIDPSNGVNSIQNLQMKDGHIAYIGPQMPESDEVIDAAGRVVCPGFIDIHMHEDPVGEDGKIRWDIYPAMLKMGVTTAVGGNCGSNACDPSFYLDTVDHDGAPVNIALFAGHSSIRRRAGVTNKYESATQEQIAGMEKLTDSWLQAGCVGVSFGLRYVPGTQKEEFHRVAARCSAEHRLISAHVRDDADAIFSAIDEMAEAAQKYELPLQISHIGSMGGFGQMADVLRQADAYRLNGLDIMLDCYPYDAFSTEIGATTYDDGWLERYNCGYDVLEFCSGPWKGKRADEASFQWMRQNDPDALTVCHVMRPEDIQLALSHPAVMVASDGILDNGQGHPRAAGTFPRVFASYVRENRLSLFEAIRKMTALPAARLHLQNKGNLRVGADADVVIFDLETITDHATFASPMLAPTGIDWVFIAGEAAAHDGRIIQHLGRSIRA